MTTEQQNVPADEAGSTDETTAGETTANEPAADDPSKPTDSWVTGDEPMTGPQRSYLETLAREAGEQVPDDLTKAQASELIDRLQAQSKRVRDS